MRAAFFPLTAQHLRLPLIRPVRACPSSGLPATFSPRGEKGTRGARSPRQQAPQFHSGL